MKKVTIIVPAYHNTPMSVQLTIQCLTNITKYTDPELYDLIVVEDEPRHNLRDDFKIFKIDKHIVFKKHTNYATKVNLAVQKAETPYVAIIQNDCFVWEGWLEKFLWYFDRGKTEAMVPTQFGYTYERMQEFKKLPMSKGQEGGQKDACMIFVTRKAFEKAGGFNEQLDAFVERNFYSRLVDAGYTISTSPKIHVTHIALGTHYQDLRGLDRKTHHDGQIENHELPMGKLDKRRLPPLHKRILITGGSGSLGEALLKKLENHDVTVFSRNEGAQIRLKQLFPNVEFISGDIRDKLALKHALRDIDIVIHAAAFKFLDQAEVNPREAVYTNVVGSMNLIEAIEELGTVEACLGISTDKVVYARNVYGCTKHIMEKLFKEANFKSSTLFSCVRYGNVLGTTGAVHTIWKDQLKHKKALTVTDKRMRRFFFSVDEAVQLVFYALDNMHGGEIFAVKMPSYSIYEEAKKLSNKVIVTGLRPGEKINETLIGDYEGEEFTSEQSGNNEVVVIQ